MRLERAAAAHRQPRQTLRIGRDRVVHAVDDVTLDVHEREIVGLVGESGSGKSTLGKTLLGLHDKTAGEVTYRGETAAHALHVRATFRSDATADADDLPGSLLVAEPAHDRGRDHRRGSEAALEPESGAVRDKVAEWLTRVGLQPDHMSRYPHEFSGGQRQRIGIARALILDPSSSSATSRSRRSTSRCRRRWSTCSTS